MEKSFINVINVCDIAKILESIETYSIKPEILEDAEDFIMEFKMSLENFNHPFKDKTVEHYSPILVFDKHLDELLKSTQNLYSILTDDAKNFIHEQLAKNQSAIS